MVGILAAGGLLALHLGGHNSKASAWTSRATFTFGSDPAATGHGAVGAYTAADSSG